MSLCSSQVSNNKPGSIDVGLTTAIAQMQTKDLRRAHGNYTLAPEFTAFTMPHAFGQFSVAEMNTDRNVEQWCADCASKAGHCQESR